MTRHRLALTFLLSITSLALALPAGAVATPVGEKKAEAQRIRQQIAAFDATLGRVIDEYNQANEDLTQIKGRIKKNAKALKVAEYNLSVARRQLDARVVAIYKQRPVELLDVVLSAGEFEDVASQLDFMHRLGVHDTELIDSAASYRKEVQQRRARLVEDRKDATTLVARVAQKKSGIEDKLAERRSLLQGVEQEIRELERAEEEAARRAAQAAVARAQAAEAAGNAVGDTSSGGGASTGVAGTTPDQRPIVADPAGPGRPHIVAIAARYLGTPYKYGGTSPQTGFDCSGFVQFVYAQAGIGLPRTSMTQQQIGTRVSMNALQPGDLVFRGYPAYHVGIYVGGGQAIHSPRTGYTVCYQSISYWTSAVRP
ncbi:MAG: C40 family peptidase [Actinobacteria bacterium]|nr:C40 family peptidase [Actinomycetota bacterium]